MNKIITIILLILIIALSGCDTVDIEKIFQNESICIKTDNGSLSQIQISKGECNFEKELPII